MRIARAEAGVVDSLPAAAVLMGIEDFETNIAL
jgi:hypothetical protein